jgi:hypothetical protein
VATRPLAQAVQVSPTPTQVLLATTEAAAAAVLTQVASKVLVDLVAAVQVVLLTPLKLFRTDQPTPAEVAAVAVPLAMSKAPAAQASLSLVT